MWPIRVFILCLVTCQASAAQTVTRDRWHVTVVGESLRFSSAAVDTSATPDTRASLRPSARLGLQAGLARAFGAWEVAVYGGYAGGQIEVYNRAIKVVDETAPVTRYRLAASAGRAVTHVGSGRAVLQVGPTLDLWRVAGESRLRLGAEVRVGLRLPLGPVELENRITAGISGGPIVEQDTGEGTDQRSMKSVAFGVGVRVPL